MAPLREILGNVLLGLDHVGLAVKDLEVGIGNWDVLGLQPVHQERNVEQGIDEAMLAIPGDTYIQLIAPLGPDTTIAKFIEKNGEGLQQIAYRVTDINQAMTLISEAGLRLIYPEPRNGTSNSKINFIHPKDAGGILVELVEHSG